MSERERPSGRGGGGGAVLVCLGGGKHFSVLSAAALPARDVTAGAAAFKVVLEEKKAITLPLLN